MLYQSDDYGKDLLSGFRKGLGAKTRKLIVQTVGYDPTTSDVQSQVAQLKASGANTFCIFAFGKFAIQSFVYANKLGWKPQHLRQRRRVGVVDHEAEPAGRPPRARSRSLWGKDPATPKFARDAGVALAAKIIKKYVPGGNPSDGFLVAGMAEGVLVRRRAQGGRQEPDAQGPDDGRHAHERGEQPVPVPGVKVQTTPTSRFPISSVQLQRWHAGHWVPFGAVQSAKP